MRNKKLYRDESGFWSAVFVLVLTALAALGFSTYTTVRNEGINAANQSQMLMADFAATSGAYMGLALYADTSNFQPKTLTISGATVAINIASIGGGQLQLTSSASYNNSSSTVQIILDPGQAPFDLEDMAIYTTSTVTDVTPEDSTNTKDTKRMVQNADSIPTVNMAALIALSNAQGHTKIGNWDAPNDWNGSFWRADGNPNVTYVQGNMTLNGNIHIHGIFVVTGEVKLNGSTRIDGVVYLPNVTSSIIHGSGSTDESIDGGIISHGSIKGTGSHVNVANKKSYMKAFLKYMKYGAHIVTETQRLKQQIITWRSV